MDCLYSTTACVVDDAQRLALLRALEPQDRVRLLSVVCSRCGVSQHMVTRLMQVIAKRYSLNAGDVKHFAALEHARRCIEERGRAGYAQVTLIWN